MTDAIQMAGWVWRGVCVWDKGISRNQPGRFRNDCEYIVWASNGDLPIDWEKAKGTKALPGVYHIPIVPGDLPDSAGEDRRGTARRCGRAA